jgi:NhaA family Na+:H+ antiporter
LTLNDSDTDKVQAPLERTVAPVSDPFREFVNAQSSWGWLLLATTVLALGLANSGWSSFYFAFLHTDLGFILGKIQATRTLQHWVNDGLMALFFFLLGLELKRELLVGRLSDLREAGSVLSAAAGGMIVPAAIFIVISGPDVSEGWAIPMATDTAFALMILTLLGDRVPATARAFLVGLAIVDDLGAIIVIASAYTSDFDLILLAPSLFCLVILAGLNLTGIRAGTPYLVVGIALWVVLTQLGLHGTLAGVLVALAAPVRAELPRSSFLNRLQHRAEHFEEEHDNNTSTIFGQPNQQQITQDVALDAKRASSPLARWEANLEKPINFGVVPLFAFMNAGVAVDGDSMYAPLSNSLSMGIVAGLLVGKPIGILLGLWLGKLVGVAHLPSGMTWRHAFGVGLLGGIGFTMSLLVATLSFGVGTPHLELAKQTVILASVLAGTAGYCWFRWACGTRADS